MVTADVGLHDAVWRQLSTLRHRGPDTEGIHACGPAVIGQSRLRIIDIAGGDPPITSEDGTIGVALNGEIYNYRELRVGLIERGHRLETATDTEVIAHLAEDLAPRDLAIALDGMFAFACWDGGHQRLVLARDRLGKKPLYYWWGDGIFVFGSEIKALLAHPRVPERLRMESLPGYLTYGYVPTPDTFFEGIQSLPPGHVLTYTPGSPPSIESYWTVPSQAFGGSDPLDISFEQAASRVKSLLGEAVERRLVSDVPLGAFLSGGIDSSAIVAMMAERASAPVPTFCIGFDDPDGFDERRYARVVAERFKTDHTEFVVKPDAADLIERLVWHYDQPFGDSSALPTYLLCEVTGRSVTVALSGDGGDEVFGGYERFAAGWVRHHVERMPLALRRLAAGAVTTAGYPIRHRLGKARRMLADPDLTLPRSYLGWVTFVPRGWRDRLLPGRSGEPLDDYGRIWQATDGRDVVTRLLDLNLQTYLLDDLLPKVDRMSMAHGLEVRSPFLDHRLVEFAARLPSTNLVRGFSLKRVLRAAMADTLPQEILGRRKHGFGVPLDRWFRGELLPYVKSMLLSRSTRATSILSEPALAALVAEHESGAASHGHSLWTLLTLEMFLRQHKW